MMKKMLIAFIICILSALLVMPGCASEFVEPELYDWNIKCCDLGFDGSSFKIEAPPDFPWPGTHSVGGIGSITIEMVNETHFNFTATGILINAVIVKGMDSYVYNYSGPSYGSPVTADTILNPPLNSCNGKFPAISHIEFCYVEDGVEPTPTPTETPTETPTTPPTSVPEFPLFATPVIVVFSLIMGAVVLSLTKRR
ncbi:hypothetical protein L1S32_08370 [Methanogenium sp. S4BF]|uniref:hypothetical protein n=1 Tax=Methanogenium sp. S4BF TaxID=1789226 RepID=UPI002416377C|nr:hypothetical protein [Methanogenium sp. S4BF]WFN33856.1 hypothetical protein L1S32_08370 [Methanogenium sp. S4BF]